MYARQCVVILSLLALEMTAIPFSATAQSIYAKSSFNASYCRHLQSSLDKMPLTQKAKDWPLYLSKRGLVFPSWKDVDPSSGLPLIKKAVLWKYSRYFYRDVWTDKQYAAYWGTPAYQEQQWRNDIAPRYLAAIKAGQLSMQSTNVTFIVLGAPEKATVIRFRFKTDLSSAGWQYVIRTLHGSKIIRDTPISDGPISIDGELGIIGDDVVIFNTSYLPIAPVQIVGIAPDSSGDDEHDIIFVSTGCSLDVAE